MSSESWTKSKTKGVRFCLLLLTYSRHRVGRCHARPNANVPETRRWCGSGGVDSLGVYNWPERSFPIPLTAFPGRWPVVELISRRSDHDDQKVSAVLMQAPSSVVVRDYAGLRCIQKACAGAALFVTSFFLTLYLLSFRDYPCSFENISPKTSRDYLPYILNLFSTYYPTHPNHVCTKSLPVRGSQASCSWQSPIPSASYDGPCHLPLSIAHGRAPCIQLAS